MADVQAGYYLRLPDSWRDAVTLEDGLWQNSFVLYGADQQALCTVRVVEKDANVGQYETLLSLEGGQKVVAFFHDGCAPGEALTIRAGARAL